MIVIYVDDILVMSQDSRSIKSCGHRWSSTFEMKDTEEIKRCLDMDFSQGEDGIFVNQKTYVEDTLHRFGMQDCNTVSTPPEAGAKLKGEL